MSLTLLDIELTEKHIIKELGLFLMVLYKDFHFVHQRFVNLRNRQQGTQVIYIELRKVVENSVMMSSLLFSTTYDIKVMIAEVFASGHEMCRLLPRLLGQNVENLDDYGCPKLKIMSKRTVPGSAVVSFSDTKQGSTVPRRKQRCMEIGQSNLCKYLYVFSLFVLSTNVNFSIRHDFFYIIHFEKLTLRNR